MNNELWNKIENYRLDKEDEEYGFTIRLAKENYWTKKFTESAILEYKRFMYLAATTDRMVSPSNIVDKVWHLHLVYTNSYKEFCNLLGKEIQHIPSTHKRSEFQKFNLATKRTTEMYRKNFGKEPDTIWANQDMYQSLNLKKSKYKLRSTVIMAIAIFIALILPSFFLLKPFIIKIGNPDFMIYLLLLTAFILAVLEFMNRDWLLKMVKSFDKQSFIFDLHPYELMYLKTQNLAYVIHAHLDGLFKKDLVVAKSHGIIEVNRDIDPNSLTREETTIYTTLKDFSSLDFIRLVKSLNEKPIFSNTQNSMDAFKKYFVKSSAFSTYYFINFSLLAIPIMISLIRLILGAIREKPIGFIFILTIVLCYSMYLFLNRFSLQVCKLIIPKFYRDTILSRHQKENDWQWRYFLSGSLILSAGLITLVNYKDPSKNKNNDYCSSCSSCSSCGGCGGCGGCGD